MENEFVSILVLHVFSQKSIPAYFHSAEQFILNICKCTPIHIIVILVRKYVLEKFIMKDRSQFTNIST